MNIIYALKDPITDEYMYVGRSSVGIKRAESHLKGSHNILVKNWVENLMVIEQEPLIDILEECNDVFNLPDKEKYWINKLLADGHPLLNIIVYDNLADKNKEIIKLSKQLDNKILELNNKILELNNKILELNNKINIVSFDNEKINIIFKKRRKILNVSIEYLAELSEVGIATLKRFESGKGNITLNNLQKVADVLGLEVKLELKKPNS